MTTKGSPKIKGMSTQLLVADIDRAVEFYTKKLGFEISFRYEDFYVGIIREGCSIHLKCVAPIAEESASKKEDEHTEIIFSVEGIEDLYEDIKIKTIEVFVPLRDMPYGREFYISDPDGHIIAFLE